MSEKDVIHARVDGDLKTKVEAQAKKEHRTVSNFIAHVIMVYLDSINS